MTSKDAVPLPVKSPVGVTLKLLAGSDWRSALAFSVKNWKLSALMVRPLLGVSVNLNSVGAGFAMEPVRV